MANRNTAIRGVQIRDGEITGDQLSSAVNASLALADTSLQPADKYTWKGTWLVGTAYAVNDVVERNGSGYIAIDAGTGHDPEETASAYWDLLVEKGATGATGAQGIQGIQGEKGDKGDKGDTGDSGVQGVDGTTIEFLTGDILAVVDGGITETQLNVSVNASLDLADSALQSLAFAGLSDGCALVPNKYVHVGSGGLLEMVDLPTDVVGITEAHIAVEDLTGNADTSLTLSDSPVANSVQLYINGLLQEEGTGKDYTISDKAITLAVATEVDDIIVVHYIVKV